MQRLIKTEQYARLLNLFFGGELPRPRERRIAGQHVGDEECHKRDGDQDPQSLIQPAQYIVTQG